MESHISPLARTLPLAVAARLLRAIAAATMLLLLEPAAPEAGSEPAAPEAGSAGRVRRARCTTSATERDEPPLAADTCLPRLLPAISIACESRKSAACIVHDMVDNIATPALC